MNEELVSRVRQILEHPLRVPVGVGVVSFGVGMGLGYILGKRNRYEAFVEIESDLVEDPNQMRFEFNADDLAEHISEMAEATPPLTDGTAIEIVEEPEVVIKELDVRPRVEAFVANKLKESMIEHQIPEVDEEPVVSNIFAKNDGDWDYEEEKAKRSTAEPYVLHQDEFFAEETGYPQLTLTYFAGDNIMVDEDDSPVYNHQQITGDLKFGHGSNDPNVVYIRNDKRKAEYEVLYHEGHYTVEVLGLEIEDNARKRDLKHSSERKFRQVD